MQSALKLNYDFYGKPRSALKAEAEASLSELARRFIPVFENLLRSAKLEHQYGVFSTNRELAQITRCNERSIRRVLRQLDAAGLITITQATHKHQRKLTLGRLALGVAKENAPKPATIGPAGIAARKKELKHQRAGQTYLPFHSIAPNVVQAEFQPVPVRPPDTAVRPPDTAVRPPDTIAAPKSIPIHALPIRPQQNKSLFKSLLKTTALTAVEKPRLEMDSNKTTAKATDPPKFKHPSPISDCLNGLHLPEKAPPRPSESKPMQEPDELELRFLHLEICMHKIYPDAKGEISKVLKWAREFHDSRGMDGLQVQRILAWLQRASRMRVAGKPVRSLIGFIRVMYTGGTEAPDMDFEVARAFWRNRERP